MLASSLSLLGPIVLCLILYLRWQLGGADGSIPLPVRCVDSAMATASHACRFESSSADATTLRACTSGRALPATPRPTPSAAAVRDAVHAPIETDRFPAPGVYADAGSDSSPLSHDATVRGELLADRIIHGRGGAGALRRGSKGALDVVVVGANLFGISVTLRLMRAGLRVLLVDRHSWAPLDAPSHTLIASCPGPARRVRLPLVTGHHVSVVARRADGMLELQAERAAWYTANVVFASRQVTGAFEPRSFGPGAGIASMPRPSVPAAPTASRAA